MKVCGFLGSLFVGMQVCIVPSAFADSLRLPDAQQEEVSKSVPGKQGTTVIIPNAIEKNGVIITSPGITVQPGPGEDKAPDAELLESPLQQGTSPAVVDDILPTPSSRNRSTKDKPSSETKNAEPKEQIVNVKDVPVAPSETRRSTLTIEDILADPMKNKNLKPSKNDSLSLPKDTQKMDFLEGKWRCETDLINLENNSPVVIEFTFGKNGRGNARLKEKTGRVFSGSANAVLENGTLDIKVDKLVTPNSSAIYNGSNIQCKQKGAMAICSGKNTGKPAVSWDNASFHRVK